MYYSETGVLCLHWWLATKGILFLGCLCVSLSVRKLTWYRTNCLWEFHQVYNIGEVGDKDELIRFWGQKVRGQGHSETNHGKKSLIQRCTLPANTFWSMVCDQKHVVFLFFSALHGMPLWTSNEKGVCPSDVLSRDKMEERSVQIFIPYERYFA